MEIKEYQKCKSVHNNNKYEYTMEPEATVVKTLYMRLPRCSSSPNSLHA